MIKNESIISFEQVSFEHGHNKPILHEVNFSVRRGRKFTLMGQNGAGKSTIFDLITGSLKPTSGKINIAPGLSIALSRQIIPRNQMDLTVRDFFQKCFSEKVYENALMVLFGREGIQAKQQTPITVYFEGEVVGDYYADILVEDKIILEFQQCPVRFLRVLFYCSKAVIPACF